MLPEVFLEAEVEENLLNWAARYFPIIRAIKKHGLYESGTLLEVGSGPYGIGTYRKVPFTGCDLSFAAKERWPMTQLLASAADLPLSDRSFDMVLASDVLEHIPPNLRVRVISEALRVADKLVVFGFPCGKAAHSSDKALREEYLKQGRKVPEWLEEHMQAEFPVPELFSNLPGWKVEQFSNESLRFHEWMMKCEMNLLFVRITGKIVKTFPSFMDKILKNVDGEPSYRQIFVLSRVD